MVTLPAMNTRLRELIKNKMADTHISQIELAERLNVATSHVSRIISGERGTTLENLIVIADTLKIDRTYFLRVAAGLNPDPEVDEDTEKIIYESQDLTDLEKEEVLAFIHMKKNLRKKK